VIGSMRRAEALVGILGVAVLVLLGWA